MLDFQARASSLFAVLDDHRPDASAQPPAWCVSGSAFQRAGRTVEAESDDDEGDADHLQECAEARSAPAAACLPPTEQGGCAGVAPRRSCESVGPETTAGRAVWPGALHSLPVAFQDQQGCLALPPAFAAPPKAHGLLPRTLTPTSAHVHVPPQILRECLGDDEDAAPGAGFSAAACKAFQAEAEEDDFDRLAAESLSRLGCQVNLKPALKTAVRFEAVLRRRVLAAERLR